MRCYRVKSIWTSISADTSLKQAKFRGTPATGEPTIKSEAFFRKGWTNHELDGLVTRTVAGEQSLLPIWHDLTVQEVRAFSPSLADKVAMSTSQFSIEDIAEQIAEVVTGAG